MSTIAIAIILAFVLGYAAIALESFTRVNKAAIALLMFVICWTIFAMAPEDFATGVAPDQMMSYVNGIIQHHLGDTATTLFFLMGAMTIVEVVDQNGGFNFVRDLLRTTNKRTLLWRIAILAFVLSAILDNLTTSIVMVMLLRKLVRDQKDRLIYASLIVIAANSGGAFSPIGDVTTIMLWNGGMVTAMGVITELFVPSLVSMVIPVLILQRRLKGQLVIPEGKVESLADELTSQEKRIVFFLGVGGLIFVPIFHGMTGLPPFVGMLLALGMVWLTTELFYGNKRNRNKEGIKKRVSKLLGRIDMSTIMFFLGILMAVACLQEIHVLTAMGQWLNEASGGNHYLVTGIIGVLSSIVDNVPLVAGCMGMYPIAPTGDMAVDGIFWQLLAYCAGVGGSMLIIGSAAGVVAMGIERITFGWYMRNITLVAFVGYIAGIATYWLLDSFVL
ncbi:MAG: sodium:proton antiporter NhaD [Muribaculaceae bacterium]|nr:sodium:proton antiporter NhaD [Muribaculaceae bacterium]